MTYAISRRGSYLILSNRALKDAAVTRQVDALLKCNLEGDYLA